MGDISKIEQWLLEVTNQARLDPEAMARNFGFDLNAGLAPGTISSDAKQALAMSDILLDTADFHGAWVLENNSFGTVGYLGSNPGERMAYAGFNGGAPFDWSENIGWRDFATGALINEETVAYNIWHNLFTMPETRRALLSDDLNEAGFSYVNGQISDFQRQAYVMTQDLADSDAVFITGAAYTDFGFDMHIGFLPQGVAGVDIKGQAGTTTTDGAGGYRLEVDAGRYVVRLGDVRAAVSVDDENVKLDLIGTSALRSSHSVTVLSGATFAQLIGISDASLVAGAEAGAMTLEGNAGDNRLVGNRFDNWLSGAEGNDLMLGGAGDDRYDVESSGDRVIEKAGGGYDMVSTTVSFKLGANSEVELIYALHNILWDPIDLTGSLFAQELRGNYGNNRLDGGGGGDVLAGYNGDDVYIIRHSDDEIVDWAGGGNDTVKSAVSYTLEADAEIERVETINVAGTKPVALTGNGFDQTLIGNAGRNVLMGMDGDDILSGGAGHDILVGGMGSDKLRGGEGRDRFVFNSIEESPLGLNRDVILDWERGDRIDLSDIDADSHTLGRQAFSFVGETDRDAPLALAEIAFYQIGSSTYVVANTDADNGADFQIRLMGLHDLVASDFLFA